MKTVLMAVAVVKDGDKVLLRKMDPAKNPYQEPWALFGGRIEGDGLVVDSLNEELTARWNFSVTITEKLWWDEETKIDQDGEGKRFIYLDALCAIEGGQPEPVNRSETLEWVVVADLGQYDLNPPTRTLLQRLGYVSQDE